MRGFLRHAMAGIGMASALIPTARAEPGLLIGTITCRVEGGWGLVVGSWRPLACTFSRNDGAAPEPYRGTIYKFGLDLGYMQSGLLNWSVLAPSRNFGPGALAGSYAGGTASATVGFGVGANGLVGGLFNAIMLQPFSIETDQGLNVSAGVAAMTLSPG